MTESFSLADAKAHFSELVDRVEGGDAINITRRGKPVARLAAVKQPRRPINGDALRAISNTMPFAGDSGASLVRTMREGDRY